ncbi:MAG: hypothetical protein WCS77_10960, partial [Elusimicrobiaceae bacterium]
MTQPENKNFYEKIITAAAIFLSAFFVYRLIYSSYTGAKFFHCYPENGAFQLFNALRRLGAGQKPGVDFQFFHGLGTMYVHYPIFKLLGKDIFASEVSRTFTSQFLFVLGNFLFLKAFRMRTAAAAALAAASWLTTETLQLHWVTFPGNSMLGVRSFMPILTAALLLFFLRARRGLVPVSVLAGVLAGLTFLHSVEQGMAAFAALLLAQVLLPFECQKNKRMAAIALFAAGTAGTVIVFGFALWGSAFPAILKYALVSIPGDQFWYFGAPPNHLIDSPQKILQLLSRPAFLWAIFGLTPLITFLSVKFPEDRAVWSVSLFALIYGLIAGFMPNLGLSIPHYYCSVLLRIDYLLLVVAAVVWLPKLFPKEGWKIGQGAVVVTLLSLLLSSSPKKPAETGYSQMRDLRTYERLYIISNNYYAFMQEAITLARQSKNPVPLWSTYSGLPEAAVGVFNPASDYIIHALGPESRAAYVAKFTAAQPDYVTTIRKSFSSYEEWRQDTSWDFYELLLLNYRAAEVFTSHVIWARTDADWRNSGELQSWRVDITSDGTQAQIKVPRPAKKSFVVVEVEYETENPFSWLPMFGKLPRYLIAVSGAQ